MPQSKAGMCIAVRMSVNYRIIIVIHIVSHFVVLQIEIALQNLVYSAAYAFNIETYCSAYSACPLHADTKLDKKDQLPVINEVSLSFVVCMNM